MKQKLIKWSAALMTACMAYSWIPGFDIPSLVLFGEYSYPKKEDF